MAQVLQMQAAPELGKSQFEHKMEASSDREPPTPASPDSGDARGRRRDREDSGDEGPDGETGRLEKEEEKQEGARQEVRVPARGLREELLAR